LSGAHKPICNLCDFFNEKRLHIEILNTFPENLGYSVNYLTLMHLGKNKFAAILFIFLIGSFNALGQAGKSHKYLFEGNLQRNDVVSGESSLTIFYSLPELSIDGLTNENGVFYRLSVPGHTITADPGKPEFPVLSRLISIPEGCAYKIKISDVVSTRVDPSKYLLNGLIYPAQNGETKQDQKQRPEFVIDRKLYSTKGLIKSDTVKIQYLGKVRGKQLSNLVISPVLYNPVSNYLEVITSMKIEVTFNQESKGSGKNTSDESLLFNELLGTSLLNYYPDDVITGYSDQPVEMIILTDTTFKKVLEPFFRWKRQRGFKLDVIYRGKNFAGETYSDIKKTISSIYSASDLTGHPPEYLLIVGDATRIPTYGSGYLTDMYYGELDGEGDFIPDMYIGRVPAPDTNSVKSFVKKIVQYEKFEFADTNKFYSRTLAFAGKDASYANYMNGQIKYAITNYLNPANRINEFHFYYPDGYTKKDSIMKLISKGLSFLNYSGHGASSGWLHVDIKSPDVMKLTNKNMYPFVISNACRTAEFDDSTAFGNKMVLASNKGAVGFIGCSNDSYWDEDFYWAVGTGSPGSDPKYTQTGLGAYDRLFHTHNELPSEWCISMGQVNYAGNLSVSTSPSLRKKYYWETYTLLGDPSVVPILGNPVPFNISIPDTLPRGIRSLSVTIDQFAYIAVSDFKDLWDASYASPSGSAVLDFPSVTGDSCMLVVTGQNRIPLIKTIYFSDLNREFVNLSETSLNDISGNNNQQADYGETLFLKLKISNLGLVTADNLRASISSTSPWVTINSDLVNIGTLPGKSETIVDNSLEITIGNDIPDRGIITLDLTLQDNRIVKKYKLDIVVHAPSLEIVNCIIDDSAYGNGNYIADPGETFNLVFQIRNLGSSNTSGQLLVESIGNDLEIMDQNVKSGILHFGEVTNIPVMVKLSESSLIGEFLSLSSILDCSPFSVNKDFELRVGKVRENFEAGSFNIYPWINISSKPWKITESTSVDGTMAARSGAIGHNSISSLIMRINYPEPDLLKFYYKVSSETNYDFFQFKLNGNVILDLSGEIPWTQESVEIPAGLNKLEWIYKKDNSVSQGADCAMIDLIDFSVSTPLIYIARDLELSKIEAPIKKENYGQELVTVKVMNMGADTLNGFNLAYTVNNKPPVIQNFPVIMPPFGDSVIVTFDKRADLDLNGIYDLVVFGYNNFDDYLRNDTLALQFENSEVSESFHIFPNPFITQLNVLISSNSMGTVHLTLTDLSGRDRITMDQAVVEGENTVIINAGQLNPGYYILQIRGPDYTKSFPVIKKRQ
jgi:hypothetical protein